jgi:hypothetical protein
MDSATLRATVHKGGQDEARSTPLTGRLQPPFGQRLVLERAAMGTRNKLHQIPAFSKWPLAASMAVSAISHNSLSSRMVSVTCVDSIISAENTPNPDREY